MGESLEADNEQSVCLPSHIRTGSQHCYNRRASLDLVCGACVEPVLAFIVIYQRRRKTGLKCECVGSKAVQLAVVLSVWSKHCGPNTVVQTLCWICCGADAVLDMQWAECCGANTVVLTLWSHTEVHTNAPRKPTNQNLIECIVDEILT